VNQIMKVTVWQELKCMAEYYNDNLQH